MISEKQFNEIKEKAKLFKHSSFDYTYYEDCDNSDILNNNKESIILIDNSQAPALIQFATDNFELIVKTIEKIHGEIQINFVPHEYKEILEEIGLSPWAEFIDFFNYDLAETVIENNDYDDIEFLCKDECDVAAFVSKSVTNQSRGFLGETEDWFSDWIDENDVIIIREGNIIVGFCCVAIYKEGTNLWIREVAVHPDFQGRGLGKKLVEQAICYGINKGATVGFLHADVLNDNAIKVYNKYGFKAKEEKGELQMRRSL